MLRFAACIAPIPIACAFAVVSVAVVATTSSCSFFTRAFACTSDADCLDDQHCSAAVCVAGAPSVSEGEGASSEGEGASSEGEGASSEGEGASSEGEGAAAEGEGVVSPESGEGEGEGEGDDCAPLYVDEFDGADVVPPFAISDQPPNVLAVVSGGRFVMHLTSSAAPAYAAEADVDVRETVFTTLIADAPEFNGNELFVAGAFKDATFEDGLFADILNGQLRLVRRENGIDASHAVTFDPIAHRAARVRFLDSAHQVVLEASADGVTFTTVTTVNASSTANTSPAYLADAVLGYGATEAPFSHGDTLALDAVKLERNACVPPL